MEEITTSHQTSLAQLTKKEFARILLNNQLKTLK
jgi:hypothetical protein